MLSRRKKIHKRNTPKILIFIENHRDPVGETFQIRNTSNPTPKPSKIIDFSLLSLTCEEFFVDLELESENFKICWEQPSTRSLQIWYSSKVPIHFQFSLVGLKIGIFGIFSSGDVSHPTYRHFSKNRKFSKISQISKIAKIFRKVSLTFFIFKKNRRDFFLRLGKFLLRSESIKLKRPNK